MIQRILIPAFIGGIGLLMGCISLPLLPDLDPVCRIAKSWIDEPSGLVESHRYPGVFWVHNDSGDRARIFAITANCEEIAEFAVEGAESRDWEDIAIDDDGNLYLGDIGNNWNKRRNLTVYRVPEPNPYGEEQSVRADIPRRFHYADQRIFSPLWRWNFDAEALFWMDGALYILTKHRSDAQTTLYRLPATPSLDEIALEPIADLGLYFSLAGNVTGADLHADGGVLAILTYQAIYLFARLGDGEGAFHELQRIGLNPLIAKQVESIAWDGNDLLFGNEERDLFRIPNALP